MVLTELLPMLAATGLDTSRVSFIGWSMGGYGALVARRCARSGPNRRDLRSRPGAVSRTMPRRSRQGAFDGPADWFAYSVYGTRALSEIPLRIDCGAGDRYYMATKQFVASLRRPPAGVSFAGGHDVAAWREKLPRQLAWLAT